jgi:UDP-galactopyranose mutase
VILQATNSIDNDVLNTGEASAPAGRKPILLCLSHLRWRFVLQRPQHLMQRFAARYQVIFWEEPVDCDGRASLDVFHDPSGVMVATPRLSPELSSGERLQDCTDMLAGLIADRGGEVAVRWLYTPMMLPLARSVDAAVTVYDCMDELSAFKFAPPELPALEAELLDAADVVFTGGYSLYEAKRDRHANIYPFPSSVDRTHFAKAREVVRDANAAPTFGFYGVIDERLDLDLLAWVADARPDYRFEIVGPVVKIDPAELPRRDNIVYPGGQEYADLPQWLGRWDVALMPFAINESTRFISPTKTPEYLSGGRPVVSTPITDVGRHYGELDAVFIADNADAFIAACDDALALSRTPESWLPAVDRALASLSWDVTQAAMQRRIDEAAERRAKARSASRGEGGHYDFLIVGAGFAGAVMAERLANEAGKRVLVIDKRDHIAGNAFDERDAAGNLIHRYGPHIFHTNSAEIFDYLSRFTEWRPYEHRVLGEVRGQLVPIPINRTTLNKLYGLSLDSDDAVEAFFASRAEPVEDVRTSEDVVVGRVGRELYELFFRGYTRKQWALDPSELDKSVTARVPTRTNTDDRYFTDTFQAMPAEGYTAMFERMLDHPNIDVRTGTDYREVKDVTWDRMVWTGAVDEYFGHCYGKLPYRSLRFEHEIVDTPVYQPTGTVNYPSEDVPYTRISEFRHMTGDDNPQTSIVREYPSAEGDPYYPIPRPETQALYKKYETLARACDTIFVGRLATYRYYNMDQIVGQALATFRRLDLDTAPAMPLVEAAE